MVLLLEEEKYSVEELFRLGFRMKPEWLLKIQGIFMVDFKKKAFFNGWFRK